MIKPILIIKLPFDFPPDQINETADAVNAALEQDYFVLAVLTKNRDFEFQGINTDGMKPGEFETLVQDLIVKVSDLDLKKVK